MIIPDTVTELGAWAIRYSPTLKCIYLPDSITTIGLRGCSRNEVADAIRFSNGFTTIGDFAFAQNSTLKYQKVAGNIEIIGEKLFEGCTSLEHVTFEGITELKTNTLTACSNLKRVDLPETLTTIGSGVFMNTGLETVKIPMNVASVDTNAFYLCEDLKSVYIDSPTIANKLTSNTVCGRLISYAKYIYIKNDITEVGSYLKNKCTQCADIGGYTLYIVNE